MRTNNIGAVIKGVLENSFVAESSYFEDVIVEKADFTKQDFSLKQFSNCKFVKVKFIEL